MWASCVHFKWIPTHTNSSSSHDPFKDQIPLHPTFLPSLFPSEPPRSSWLASVWAVCVGVGRQPRAVCGGGRQGDSLCQRSLHLSVGSRRPGHLLEFSSHTLVFVLISPLAPRPHIALVFICLFISPLLSHVCGSRFSRLPLTSFLRFVRQLCYISQTGLVRLGVIPCGRTSVSPCRQT